MKSGLRATVMLAPAALVASAGLASVAAASSPGAETLVERQAYVMGTPCTLAGAASSRAAGLRALEAGLRELAATEDLLSTWRRDTPLERLNRAPLETPVALPAALLQVLLRVEEVWRRSRGAFDPAVGRLVAAWDLRGTGRTPSPRELAAARQGTGLHLLVLDPAAGTAVRRSPGPLLDAGGFGKGEGLARAAAALKAAGLRRWWIDFGGQVVVAADGDGRQVALAHPGDRERPVGWLRLRGLSAATSSAAERPGHILDPRSGRPAAPFGSVTVVSPDPFLADAAATALYVLGPGAGLAAAADLGVEALFLVRDGDGLRARATPGMDDLIIRLETPLRLPPSHQHSQGGQDPCDGLY